MKRRRGLFTTNDEESKKLEELQEMEYMEWAEQEQEESTPLRSKLQKSKPRPSPLSMKHWYIGIDPGQTGAIAVIDENLSISHLVDWSGEILIAETMRKINKEAIGKGIIVNAALEYAHAMPKQGVSSMFKFGTNYGVWIGILATLQISFTVVTPQKWQKGVIKKAETKKPAVTAAQRLFPTAELHGPRGGAKDGRADALLIAYWCKRNFSND